MAGKAESRAPEVTTESSNNSSSSISNTSSNTAALSSVVQNYRERLQQDPAGTLSSLGVAPVSASVADRHQNASLHRTVASGTNVSGTKTVVGLQFRVKDAGVYPVTILNAVVYDNQNPPQPIPGIAWFAGAVSGA
jgi:hypothetical protein